MESLLHWLLYIVGTLIIFSFLPVTKEIVRPILNGIGHFVLWCFTESSAWVIFSVKELYRSHTILWDHLMNEREEFLPEEKVRKMTKDSRSKKNKPL